MEAFAVGLVKDELKKYKIPRKKTRRGIKINIVVIEVSFSNLNDEDDIITGN